MSSVSTGMNRCYVGSVELINDASLEEIGSKSKGSGLPRGIRRSVAARRTRRRVYIADAGVLLIYC